MQSVSMWHQLRHPCPGGAGGDSQWTTSSLHPSLSIALPWGSDPSADRAALLLLLASEALVGVSRRLRAQFSGGVAGGRRATTPECTWERKKRDTQKKGGGVVERKTKEGVAAWVKPGERENGGVSEIGSKNDWTKSVTQKTLVWNRGGLLKPNGIGLAMILTGKVGENWARAKQTKEQEGKGRLTPARRGRSQSAVYAKGETMGTGLRTEPSHPNTPLAMLGLPVMLTGQRGEMRIIHSLDWFYPTNLFTTRMSCTLTSEPSLSKRSLWGGNVILTDRWLIFWQCMDQLGFLGAFSLKAIIYACKSNKGQMKKPPVHWALCGPEPCSKWVSAFRTSSQFSTYCWGSLATYNDGRLGPNCMKKRLTQPCFPSKSEPQCKGHLIFLKTQLICAFRPLSGRV